MNVKRFEKFTEAAMVGLSVAMGSDSEIIRTQVNEGINQLYQIDDTWLVLRVEGDELVIVCLEGEKAIKILNYLRDSAANQNIKTIRFHCSPNNFKWHDAILKRTAAKHVENVYRLEI